MDSTRLLKKALKLICKHHLLRLLTLCFVIHFGGNISQAQAEPSLEYSVIEASHEKEFKVSEKLKTIQKTLQASFKQFNQFNLIVAHEVNLKPKSTVSLPIGSELEMKMIPLNLNTQGVSLLIDVPKLKIKHTLHAKNDKLFFEALKWKGKAYLIAIKPKLGE